MTTTVPVSAFYDLLNGVAKVEAEIASMKRLCNEAGFPEQAEWMQRRSQALKSLIDAAKQAAVSNGP